MRAMGAREPREEVIAMKFKKNRKVILQPTSERAQRSFDTPVGFIAASTAYALRVGPDAEYHALQLQEIAIRLTNQLYEQMEELADNAVELQAITGMIATNLAVTFIERHEYFKYLLDLEGDGHEG